MRATVLFTGLLCLASLAVQAQCTPDLSFTQAGIYPRPLPHGMEGVNYSQVIQFKVPKDTLSLTVDSFYVIHVDGGPAGLVYNCDHANCGYKGNTNGCALLTAPLPIGSAGTYNLVVTAFVKFKPVLPGFPPVTQSFTNTMELIIDQAVGIRDTWNDWKSKRLMIYPNPTSGIAGVRFAAARAQAAHVTVLNMLGNVVSTAKIQAAYGQNDFQMDFSALPEGVYFITVQADGRLYKNKMIRVN